MSHVFISYMRDDQSIVDRLCEELRSRGVEIWLDRTSIRPGERWKDAIREAISQGSYFIACFSNAYTSKDTSYMNEELTLAIEALRLKAFGREWFIPVLLSECEVPARSIGGGETLMDFQWVDLYTDFQDGLRRLMLVLNVDEVNRLRELIDDYGYWYTRRSTAHTGREKVPRLAYLNTVEKLQREFGITYDPIKLLAPPRPELFRPK